MIAFCGINCLECGAFLATKFNDDKKRQEVAELWSKQFNADIKPEDINCEGCLSITDNVFAHCKVCEIRKCGFEKEIKNCAHCSEYVCNKLDSLLKVVPEAKEQLEKCRVRIRETE